MTNNIETRDKPIKAANFVYLSTVPVQAFPLCLNRRFSDDRKDMSVVLMFSISGNKHTLELVVQLLSGSPIKIVHPRNNFNLELY